MAKMQTVLEVFIASPSDVAPEREVLESVVSEFNLTWGNRHQVRLELLKWETHSRPALGIDAQDVINRQIGNEFDIFLGIMWGRFGTATARADSGTEEEFNRAYDRLKNGDRVQIMFYFKDAGIPPSKLDGSQIAKIQLFKNKIADEYGGLYYQFESIDDFQTKARIHLSKVVQDWLDSNTGVVEMKQLAQAETPERTEYNPLANLAAIDESETEEGVEELVDRGVEAMKEVVEIVNRMTTATSDLGEKFTQRTAEAKEISGKNDRKSAKRIVNNVANDLEVFVKRMSVEIPEFYKHNAVFAESFSKVAMTAEGDLSEDAEDVDAALNSMQAFREAIESSSGNLTEFRQRLSKMPRTTTQFNQARRRAVAIVDDLLTQFRIAASQIGDIEILLKRLLKTKTENIQ